MSAELNIESQSQATPTGYDSRRVTKVPNWHGLVVWDILFNNLSTGLFMVAALGELVAPASFEGVARLAYPTALLLLIGDLVCLVLDLGDPFRFHHMLRVWKPSSPMSLGTWCLTVYAAPLTALSVMSLLPGDSGPEWIRRLMIVIGLVPALGAAMYKGVLFSTTAQPGWKDARWLGGYLSSSALVLGAGQLLLLAIAMEQSGAIAALRPALTLLLLFSLLPLGLLLSDLRIPLSRAHGARALAASGAVTVLAGTLIPLWLLMRGTSATLGGAVLVLLLVAILVRFEIVRLPRLLTEAKPHPTA
jgi:Ni/Fe-hydrogenase subunit HybB-like protein